MVGFSRVFSSPKCAPYRDATKEVSLGLGPNVSPVVFLKRGLGFRI